MSFDRRTANGEGEGAEAGRMKPEKVDAARNDALSVRLYWGFLAQRLNLEPVLADLEIRDF